MPPLINWSHITISLVIQLIFGFSTSNWLAGTVAAIFFFLGREIAQTEYRKIKDSQSQLRKDMHPLGGLDPKYWTTKSFFADLLIPGLLVIIVYIATYLL